MLMVKQNLLHLSVLLSHYYVSHCEHFYDLQYRNTIEQYVRYNDEDVPHVVDRVELWRLHVAQCQEDECVSIDEHNDHQLDLDDTNDLKGDGTVGLVGLDGAGNWVLDARYFYQCEVEEPEEEGDAN